MNSTDIKRLNEELTMALNEMAQIGHSFNGNHKVQVMSGDHIAYYLKDNKILYKFKRPAKCPKSLSDIKELEDFKSPECTDKELNILVSWFSEDYVTLKGKTIKGETNFERLDDEFEAQNAVINQKTQAVDEATKNMKETNLKELKELIYPMKEMSMAWVDQKSNRCCWVENITGHSNDYFKYLDSFSFYKADYIARISLREPKYLEHINSDGKKEWKLNNSEKKELVELMNSPSGTHPNLTKWQDTLIQYNMDNFFIQPLETINKTFDKEKYPNAYDIDYPMPNYLELK